MRLACSWNIIIKKNTIGGDGTFNFTGDLGEFSLSTQNNVALREFNNQIPKTYSISETVPEGWDLTNATCDDGSSVDAIKLDLGETVTCTFTNTKRGKITVIKTTERTTSKWFPFITDFAGTFSLGQNGSWISEYLTPGTYTVSEGALHSDHWSFDNLNCVDSAQLATFVQNKKAVMINLAAGSNVVCTYYNDYSRNDEDDGGDGGDNNLILTTGGTGTTGGTTQGGEVQGENTENNPEGTSNEGGNVLGEETQGCQSWPLWIWIVLVLAFSGIFNYVIFNGLQEIKKLKWLWPSIWTIISLGVWYYYDNCRAYKWFPYTYLIIVVLSYIYYLRKIFAKK